MAHKAKKKSRINVALPSVKTGRVFFEANPSMPLGVQAAFFDVSRNKWTVVAYGHTCEIWNIIRS